MKKSWIAFLVVLIVVFVGCKETPDVITPPPQLSPEFVQATAIPAVVEYKGTVTIKFKVANAEYVMVNNTRLGPEDSIKVSDLTSTTTINIAAYGKSGTFSSKVVSVTVLPAPHIPDRTDSLCSMVWSLESSTTFDKDNNIISKTNFTSDQLAKKYYFNEDGSGQVFDKNGTLVSYGGPGTWRWGGPNIFLSGDQTYVYTLQNNVFCNYIWSTNKSEKNCTKYIGTKL